MSRRGAAGGWDDDAESSGGRSRRGDSGASYDGRGRGRMSSSQVTSALREAQELQAEGRLGEAIGICEDLLRAGVNRAEANYFLGWLYQEADRWAEAAEQFELLLDDPEYSLSCYYALGQCARAMGNAEQAAEYFDEAVDRVNLDALTQDESSQLLQLCQEAAEAHRDMNDIEGAETIYSALLGFLRSQGWHEQAAEAEQMMADILGTAGAGRRRRRPKPTGANIPQYSGGPDMQHSGLVPVNRIGSGRPMTGTAGHQNQIAGQPNPYVGSTIMPAPMTPGGSLPGNPAMTGQMGAVIGPAGVISAPGAGGDQLAQLIGHLSSAQGMRNSLTTLSEPQRTQVAAAVRDIDNYVAHGLLTAALEVCQRVIDIAPQYLDVHLLMGEIYVRQQKIEQAVQKYTMLVQQYTAQGRIDDAIATYRRILALEPNNLNYRIALIELLNRQGRIEEVQEERVAIAESYQRMGYTDRALGEYEQAILAQPNNLRVRLGYAQSLARAGRTQQAVGEFQRVLSVDPMNVHALASMQIVLAQSVGLPAAPSMSGPNAPGRSATRASALGVLGRLARALRADRTNSYPDVVRTYLQALEQGQPNADLRYGLGQVHLATGRFDESIPCFKQAAAMASGDGLEVLARYALGQAYLAKGDANSAALAATELEQAAAAARRNPPDPNVWAERPRQDGEQTSPPETEVNLLLGRAYQLSGQMGKLQETLQQAQERPRNEEIYRLLAQIAASTGDTPTLLQEYAKLARRYRDEEQTENAFAVLQEMTRLAPDDPAIYKDLADLQVQRGFLDDGLAHYRRLQDIYTRRGQLQEVAKVQLRQAEITWDLGNREQALDTLRQAVRLSQDDTEVRQQLVHYLLQMDKDPASPARREAADHQFYTARYYFMNRKTADAIAALQQSIVLNPQNEEAYDLLGQTFYQIGEFEQAAHMYRLLMTRIPNSLVGRARLNELQAMRQQYP